MLSENLIRIRKRMGLTQGELADRAGVTSQTIWSWEAGRHEPKGKRLDDLASALGVSSDDLLTADYSKNRIPVLGRIPAGIPLEAITDILDYEDIPTAWRGEYFGLRVSGDSMYPEYRDGDTVIVRSQSDCDTGDDCIVLVNGFDATLKTVIKHDDGIELKPFNEKYKSMFFQSGVQILGVVVEIRRRKRLLVE